MAYMLIGEYGQKVCVHFGNITSMGGCYYYDSVYSNSIKRIYSNVLNLMVCLAYKAVFKALPENNSKLIRLTGYVK